ncbi:hypothetical protein Q0Z83_003180 [Actinoplanes sichuanensis]|uniref:Uncharacterized protein n=1 Tax=Actinoplanes sichuanensis TaxID=512349 RepID=A0ABW4AGH3_9ACTN|nr:hypothetical protein [Actinoplanes sichuanensis]BEL02127.1 hypothetical protein Q0Z83_003180 [Actinoplanes sichuanensis]
MTISIGSSHAPSAWETHAAWLRLRADGNRLGVDVAAGAEEPALQADRTAVLESRDAIARMTPPGVVNVLV